MKFSPFFLGEGESFEDCVGDSKDFLFVWHFDKRGFEKDKL